MKEKLKANKGFSLAELIVVIVILAILVGVTLGGLYAWVNKARINTDIKNADTIQRLAMTAYMNDVIPNIYMEPGNNRKYLSINNGNAVAFYYWKEKGTWSVTDDYNKLVWVKNSGYGSAFFNDKDWKSYFHRGDNSSTLNLCTYNLYKSGLVPELPKSQSGHHFVLIYYFNADGSLRKIVCKIALKDTGDYVNDIIKENQ